VDRTHEPVAPSGELVPPYEMSDEAQQVWDATVADLEAMGIASPADRWALAGFVELAALHARVTQELGVSRC
jgi:hypothetical protein